MVENSPVKRGYHSSNLWWGAKEKGRTRINMSRNLALSGYGIMSSQTSTVATYEALALHDRYAILEYYKKHYIEPHYPPELQGKDARNKYLVEQRKRIIEELDEEYWKIKEFLLKNPQAQWYAF